MVSNQRMKRVKGAVNNLLSFTVLLTFSKTIKAIPNVEYVWQAQSNSDWLVFWFALRHGRFLWLLFTVYRIKCCLWDRFDFWGQLFYWYLSVVGTFYVLNSKKLLTAPLHKRNIQYVQLWGTPGAGSTNFGNEFCLHTIRKASIRLMGICVRIIGLILFAQIGFGNSVSQWLCSNPQWVVLLSTQAAF